MHNHQTCHKTIFQTSVHPSRLTLNTVIYTIPTLWICVVLEVYIKYMIVFSPTGL